MTTRFRAVEKKAFTLIELLIVIAVMGILIALLSPALKSAQQNANRTSALSNLRQIGIGLAAYASEHDNCIPGQVSSRPYWWDALAPYVKDARVYALPGDSDNYINRGVPALNTDANNTSFIYNGFNDLIAAAHLPTVVRLPRFTNPPQTILLAVQITGSHQRYADTNDSDDKNIIRTGTFGDNSPYLFADGSARVLTKTEYAKLRPAIWFADKTYVPIP
jgi:prepilin-type N-terminal cleavage/methylation domain-containing protein